MRIAPIISQTLRGIPHNQYQIRSEWKNEKKEGNLPAIVSLIFSSVLRRSFQGTVTNSSGPVWREGNLEG